MGEIFLVSGANRGIGLALVRELASRGHRVFAGARNPEGSEALRVLCGRHPDLVTSLELDITKDAVVENAIRTISIQHIDVLVNNAGIFPEEGNERIEEMDLQHFVAAFETNVVGTARLIQRALPLLRRSARPRIANISSGAGSIGEKEDNHYYAYSTSKAAMNMLTRALAAELKPENIVVAAISPGWVKTEMGGPNAVITAEESAKALATTFERLSVSRTGRFLGRDGKEDGYIW